MAERSTQHALSQRDRDLLSSLSNPSTDANAVLFTLAPDEVGPWLERPEIQSAIAAAFELREIRLRFKLNAATDRAIDRMTAVFEANKDLNDATQRSETRRAASAIFRVARAFQPVSSRGAAASPSHPFGGSGIADRLGGRAMTRGAPSTTPSTAPPTSSASPNGSTQHSARSTQPSAPAETPPLDTSTPQASIAGVLNAFKQLPSDAPRAALKLVERAIADPINEQPVFKERFLTHLAASPALTCRHRPFTADPIRIDGAVATQRITYTLEDGATSAAIFRATRKDPQRYDRYPTPSWPIDCIHPDTS